MKRLLLMCVAALAIPGVWYQTETGSDTFDLVISANGEVSVDGVAVGSLEDALAEMEANDRRAVRLKAHDSVRAGRVLEVMAGLQQWGVERVLLPRHECCEYAEAEQFQLDRR